MRKTLEGEEDLGGAGTPLSERGPYPPNLPDPPRTSPTTPPFEKQEFDLLFEWQGRGGSFSFRVGGGI